MVLNQNENGYNWDSFILEWNAQYLNAKHILCYLNTYPGVLSKVKLADIHNSNSIDSAHQEWLWLISKFTNPIDIEFFKPYFVPIKVDSIDYFIDISDDKYPIFEVHYFFYEPYKWYKQFIVEDITEMLLAQDTGLDLRKVLKENDRKRWKDVDEFFAERKRLGFEGKLFIEPVKKEEFTHESKDVKFVTFEIKYTFVEVTGVTSIIAGLLPFDLPIKLMKTDDLYYQPKIPYKKVKFIRDLVFLLRDIGIRGVKSYQAEFLDSSNGILIYRNNTFSISHPKREIIDDFIEKLMTSQ